MSKKPSQHFDKSGRCDWHLLRQPYQALKPWRLWIFLAHWISSDMLLFVKSATSVKLLGIMSHSLFTLLTRPPNHSHICTYTHARNIRTNIHARAHPHISIHRTNKYALALSRARALAYTPINAWLNYTIIVIVTLETGHKSKTIDSLAPPPPLFRKECYHRCHEYLL
jgi:hypothetical protein